VGDGEKGSGFVDLYKASTLRRGGFYQEGGRQSGASAQLLGPRALERAFVRVGNFGIGTFYLERVTLLYSIIHKSV
jgi:hypothetical protein